MPQGGARARSGPPPNPDALRRDRDAAGSWTDLPAEGRLEPAPVFPLPDMTPREAVLWAEEWSKPQAVMWERLRLGYEVALYVRRCLEVELHGSIPALGTLLRQQQESLGLSLAGLLRNRWRIVPDELATARLGADSDDREERARLRAAFGAG